MQSIEKTLLKITVLAALLVTVSPTATAQVTGAAIINETARPSVIAAFAARPVPATNFGDAHVPLRIKPVLPGEAEAIKSVKRGA